MELMFTGEFPPCPGGIANFMYARCQHPPRDGLRVLAAEVPGSDPWDADCGLAIRRFPYRHGGSLFPGTRRLRQIRWSRSALHRELREARYRLITANVLFPFGWTAVRTKRKSGHRVAVFCHGAELLRAALSAPARWFYRRTMPEVDLYVANSPLTADVLASHGWDRRRICVIPPPMDGRRFHPGVDGQPLRAKWSENGCRGPILLTVCRLDDWGKGIDIMVQVVARLRHDFPDIRYVVIGQGPLRRRYESLVRELGLARHVLFAGWVSDADLPQCYAACDAFVLASRLVAEAGYYEGFGIAYREAMACARPIIASKEAGYRDYVRDGENGRLIDPRNVNDIVRVCREVLGDPAGAARLGARAADFARQEPDWSALEELA